MEIFSRDDERKTFSHPDNDYSRISLEITPPDFLFPNRRSPLQCFPDNLAAKGSLQLRKGQLTGPVDPCKFVLGCGLYLLVLTKEEEPPVIKMGLYAPSP